VCVVLLIHPLSQEHNSSHSSLPLPQLHYLLMPTLYLIHSLAFCFLLPYFCAHCHHLSLPFSFPHSRAFLLSNTTQCILRCLSVRTLFICSIKQHSFYIWTELNVCKQKQNKNYKSAGSDRLNGVAFQLECFARQLKTSRREKSKRLQSNAQDADWSDFEQGNNQWMTHELWSFECEES